MVFSVNNATCEAKKRGYSLDLVESFSRAGAQFDIYRKHTNPNENHIMQEWNYLNKRKESPVLR